MSFLKRQRFEHLFVKSLPRSIFKVWLWVKDVYPTSTACYYFLGADGLLLNDNNRLTIVVNGGTDKIFQLTSEDNWQTAKLAATTIAADRFTYPATATFADNSIWVMNAKTNELMDSNAIPAKWFAIQKVVLKPVPKK